MMYHYIVIDLTRGADDVCPSYSIGRKGENLAEALKIIVPERYLNCNILLEFGLADGSKFVSKSIPYAEVIEYPLGSHLMLEGLMVIGIVAVDATTGAVFKPFEKTFVVSDSLNILPTEGAPYGVVADHEKRLKEVEDEVIENTKSRHEHDNKTVLDKFGSDGNSLTYDGQPIKGGGSSTQGDWRQSDPAAKDYIKNRTHYETDAFEVTWDGSTEDKDSVYLFDMEDGDGAVDKFYLVKVADDIAVPLAFESLTVNDLKFNENGHTVPGTDIVGEFAIAKFNGGYMVAPYLVYCTANSVQLELAEFETTITVGKGLWYITGGGTYLESVSFPGSVKRLDKKYVPDIIKVNLAQQDKYIVITVTDRNGGTQSAALWYSKPQKGVDYWTDEDKQEVVKDVIAALPSWTGGDY